METFILILTSISILAFISWRWVCGIDYMMKNHPDYTGNDLFGETDNDKNQIR